MCAVYVLGKKRLYIFTASAKGSADISFLNFHMVFQELRAFAQEYPEACLLLFYGGREREYHDGIEVVSVEEALPGLPGILL